MFFFFDKSILFFSKEKIDDNILTNKICLPEIIYLIN